MAKWTPSPAVITPAQALAELSKPKFVNPRRTPLAVGVNHRGVFTGFGPAVKFTSDEGKEFTAVSVNIDMSGVTFTLAPETGHDYAAIFAQPGTKVIFDIVKDEKEYKEMRNIRVDA